MGIKSALKVLKSKVFLHKWKGSGDYWENRYKTGGNSGAGSYGNLAQFKADVLNNFIKENNINTVVEWGGG